jgi:hypothetical protein
MRHRSLALAFVACLGCSSSSSTTGTHAVIDAGGTKIDGSHASADAGETRADAGHARTDATRAARDTGGGGGGGDQCSGPCCPEPSPGEACSVGDAGACPTSIQCAAGLLLPVDVACTGGRWTTEGTCDSGGGVASNGCPGAQPVNGTPCELPDATASCQYVLVCPSACDAGGAVPVAADGGVASSTGCVGPAGKVGPAQCKAGAWQTQALGSCG